MDMLNEIKYCLSFKLLCLMIMQWNYICYDVIRDAMVNAKNINDQKLHHFMISNLIHKLMNSITKDLISRTSVLF